MKFLRGQIKFLQGLHGLSLSGLEDSVVGSIFAIKNVIIIKHVFILVEI